MPADVERVRRLRRHEPAATALRSTAVLAVLAGGLLALSGHEDPGRAVAAAMTETVALTPSPTPVVIATPTPTLRTYRVTAPPTPTPTTVPHHPKPKRDEDPKPRTPIAPPEDVRDLRTSAREPCPACAPRPDQEDLGDRGGSRP